jgi:hypothetical protein
MNERIKELAREAGFKVDWQHVDVQAIKMERFEKFTQLIVKECATIIDDIPSSPQGSWSDGYYEGCRDSAKQIKQHFGVEE